MSALTALLPTRIVKSTIVSPAEAQTFLSAFILKADTDRHTSSRGDLVLSDQRRIEKALQGVFIPKPVEIFVVKEKAPRQEEEEAVVYEAEEEQEWAGQEDVMEVEEVVPVVPQQNVGGAVDKEQRKAEKKMRMKEERMKREAERAKERKK